MNIVFIWIDTPSPIKSTIDMYQLSVYSALEKAPNLCNAKLYIDHSII